MDGTRHSEIMFVQGFLLSKYVTLTYVLLGAASFNVRFLKFLQLVTAYIRKRIFAQTTSKDVVLVNFGIFFRRWNAGFKVSSVLFQKVYLLFSPFSGTVFPDYTVRIHTLYICACISMLNFSMKSTCIELNLFTNWSGHPSARRLSSYVCDFWGSWVGCPTSVSSIT